MEDSTRLVTMARLVWVVAAVALLAASVAIWLFLPISRVAPEVSKGYQAATERIVSRIGMNEVVVLNTPSEIPLAEILKGLPLACAEDDYDKKLARQFFDGVWSLGTSTPGKRTRNILGQFEHRGLIKHGPVYLIHGWGRKPAAEEGRGAR